MQHSSTQNNTIYNNYSALHHNIRQLYTNDVIRRNIVLKLCNNIHHTMTQYETGTHSAKRRIQHKAMQRNSLF